MKKLTLLTAWYIVEAAQAPQQGVDMIAHRGMELKNGPYKPLIDRYKQIFRSSLER